MSRELRPSEIVWPCLSLALTVGAYAPIGVYKNNADQLGFPLSEVAPVMALVTVAVALLATLAFYLIRRIASTTLALVLLWTLVVLLLVQSTVFQWNYGSLEDGTWYQHYSYGLTDGLCWILVATAAIRYRSWLKPRFTKLGPWLAGFIATTSALQAVSGDLPKVAYAIDHRQQFEFSSTGNVVVVLLDEAQGNIVADVLDEDPILKKAYADFHLFTDFLSNTKSTSLSVPMILTGRYYDNSVEFSKFLRGGLATNSIPRFFVQQGYAVDFYPTNDYFNDVYIDPSYLENFRERFFDLKFSAQLYDLGLFALLPHFTKRLVYDDHNWLLQSRIDIIDRVNRFVTGEESEDVKRASLDTGDSDAFFFQDAAERLSIKAGPPRFKFFHLSGAHPPFNLQEDGKYSDLATYTLKLKYKLKLLSNWLEDLRSKGVYDRSLIVVVSDHGSGRSLDTQTFVDRETGERHVMDYWLSRANATLMIKEAGAARTAPRVDKPVESIDLKDLLARLAQGESFAAIMDSLPERRVRRFFVYKYEYFRPYPRRINEYAITGPVWRPSSFVRYHAHTPEFQSERCGLAHPERLRFVDDLDPNRSDWELRSPGPDKELWFLIAVAARSVGSLVVEVGSQRREFPLEPGKKILEMTSPHNERDTDLRVTISSPQLRLGTDVELQRISVFERALR